MSGVGVKTAVLAQSAGVNQSKLSSVKFINAGMISPAKVQRKEGNKMYIYQMPNYAQNRIKRELEKALKREGFKGWELKELVAEGMSGRLSDVDYLIRVDKYAKAVM